MTSEIQEAAKYYIQNGYSVIPAGLDKKVMKGELTPFFEKILPMERIPQKFNGAPAIGLICGKVSGNTECLDIDDVDVKDDLIAMIKIKHKDIQDRLVYTKTPRGYGIMYKVEPDVNIGGHQDLAVTHIKVDEPGVYTWNNRSDLKANLCKSDGCWYINAVRLETRATGNYTIIAPSPGYEVLSGSFEGLLPISGAARNSILNLARTFNEKPITSSDYVKPAETKLKIDYPGSVYNKTADFPTLLKEHGWKKVGNISDSTTWQRPGGKSRKAGGQLYSDGQFHVYSSNAAPLEANKQYSAFAFFTFMNCDGDFSESTKLLAEAGYTPDMSIEEVTEVLKDNPDELQRAYDNSGLDQDVVTNIAIQLKLELPKGVRPGKRKVIYDQLDLSRVVEEMDDALAQVPGRWGYYFYADRLGYVTSDNTFLSYNVDNLELRSEDSFYTVAYGKAKAGKKAKLEGIRAPTHCLTKLLTYPDTTAPKIKGFAKHPVLLNDKIIGLQDGFEDGIMFQGCNEFEIDPRPYKECYDRIVDMFCKDILFLDKVKGPALFVSMMLTAVARLGIEGGCPGYFLTANEPGTGKSTMFEFVSRVVYGRMVESVDWGTDSVERRKEIIANLREGQECFLFDNIEQGEEVKSPILAQALTAGEFKARVMGKGEMVYVPAQSLFVFVGNNLTMSTELARRLLTVELMSNTQNPARRKVSIKNPTQYCLENRNEAVGCLIKMLQEGCKMKEKLDQSSGFDFWDRVVRNPILSETGVDVMHGFDESAESSEETAGITELILLLMGVFGVGNQFTTKQVYLAIADDYRIQDESEKKESAQIRSNNEDACLLLKDGMLIANANSANGLKSTGLVLGKLTNRISGNYKFIRNKTKSNKPVQHWIQVVDDDVIEGELLGGGGQG